MGRQGLRGVGNYRSGVLRERVGGVTGWSCSLGVKVLVLLLVSYFSFTNLKFSFSFESSSISSIELPLPSSYLRFLAWI